MEKKTKKQIRDGKIYSHGVKLKAIFKSPAAHMLSAVSLCKRLHRIEAEAHRLAERECNEQLPEGYSERKEASILRRLDDLLGFKARGIPVFLNGDPRGYALKIEDAYVKALNLDIERDMGGYGILAPEF